MAPPPEQYRHIDGDGADGGGYESGGHCLPAGGHCLPGPSSSSSSSSSSSAIVPRPSLTSDRAIQSWASPVAGQSQLSIPVQLVSPRRLTAPSFPPVPSTTMPPSIVGAQLIDDRRQQKQQVANLVAAIPPLPSSPSSLAPCSSSNCSAAGSMGSILASGKSRIFPSTRFFIALLLCLCYVSLSISTSNISVSMVCMVRKSQQQQQMASPPNGEAGRNGGGGTKLDLIDAKEREKSDVFLLLRRRRTANGANESMAANSTTMANSTEGHQSGAYHQQQQRECDGLTRRVRKQTGPAGGEGGGQNRTKRLTVWVESCHEAEKLAWSSTDQGIVFAAQNAGSLLMLFTGAQADRLNSKWTITGALALLVLSNALLPLVASASVWLVVAARLLTGLSDALLQPSTSSLITRWFPPKERPFAIGLITGGRQIGTLLILPLAGFLCSQQDILGGWPAIFYLSALIGSGILLVWLLMAADKPSKHFCTSRREQCFVEQKIAEERLGKRTERRKIPWRRLATCGPLHVGVAALICHEYPLVIMLQLLPKYINDVLHLSNFITGVVSALPIAVLFLSKTFSASASSYIQARKKGRFLIGRTALVKWFNGIASLGLGICVGIVPLLHSDQQRVEAIVVLCLANAFAGLHTPGVQTALLQIAPAYTGIITGIAFGSVAIVSIINKILSSYILQSSTLQEWTIVFWIAAVIALLPVVFFTIWGSAERQPWAGIRRPAEGASQRRASREVPGASSIFAISNQSHGKDQFAGNGINAVPDIGHPNGDKEAGEEEEDVHSEHFEPEVALASALRLQMFLDHPEEELAEEEAEGSGEFLAEILQTHAEKVRQMLHRPEAGEEGGQVANRRRIGTDGAGDEKKL